MAGGTDVPRVLVAGKIHPAGLDLLHRARGVTVDYVEDVAPAAFLSRIADADALVLRTQPLTAAIIAGAPRLRIVCRHGVGTDAVDIPALDARGIPLAVVGDVNAATVAEHAMMLILAATHRLLRYDASVRSGNWTYRDRLEAREIAGKRLLIVGLGRIGSRLARLASAFEMSVHGYDPFRPGPLPDGIVRAADLTAALEAADVVSLHVPRTATPLIGAAELARMKPGAVLVSTARGGVVDEGALVDALCSGRLGAAGIDVFEEEPPAPGHPLLGFDNVVLTPHSAGITSECAERMARVSAQNVLDFFAGRLDPALVVNLVSGGSGR
jgi:D-3-phosphoglycerate dehydrogenase